MNIKSNTKKSERDYWQTPPFLIKQIQSLLNVKFVLDPCCNDSCNKADLFFTEEMNGLSKNWISEVEDHLKHEPIVNPAVFVNPPFSQLNEWIDKIIQESICGLTVVLIHPDTPDTSWYQRIERDCFIQLVPTNRINYIMPGSGKVKNGVSFASCISVFNGWPVQQSPIRQRFILNKPQI